MSKYMTEYQFKQTELITKLKELGNWIEGFDKNELDKFVADISNLKFTSPKKEDVFNAFKIGENNSIIEPKDVRILIIGQDPYTEKSGKADGCAFSVANDKTDASLLNIFKAIKAAYDENKTFDDIKKEDVSTWSCDLKGWATNNHVLLLNAALTHESTVNKVLIQHRNAWEIFVRNTIIKLLTCSSEKLVVFLWGKHAQNLFFRCVESFGINNCDYNSVNKIILGCKNKTNKISREVLCLTTGHPTPNHDVVHKYGFSEDAPCHFKACDEFLGEKIWKNFPENNQ